MTMSKLVWTWEKVSQLDKAKATALHNNAVRCGRHEVARLAEKRLNEFDAKSAGILAHHAEKAIRKHQGESWFSELSCEASGLDVIANIADGVVFRKTYGTPTVANRVASKLRKKAKNLSYEATQRDRGLVLTEREVRAHERELESGDVAHVQEHERGFWVRPANDQV